MLNRKRNKTKRRKVQEGKERRDKEAKRRRGSEGKIDGKEREKSDGSYIYTNQYSCLDLIIFELGTIILTHSYICVWL